MKDIKIFLWEKKQEYCHGRYKNVSEDDKQRVVENRSYYEMRNNKSCFRGFKRGSNLSIYYNGCKN